MFEIIENGPLFYYKDLRRKILQDHRANVDGKSKVHILTFLESMELIVRIVRR